MDSGNSAGHCPQHPLWNPLEENGKRSFCLALDENLRRLWKTLLFFH